MVTVKTQKKPKQIAKQNIVNKQKFDTNAYVFSYPIEKIKEWLDWFDSVCENPELNWPTQQECDAYCILKRDYLTATTEGDTVILLNAIESRVTGLYDGKKKKGDKK